MSYVSGRPESTGAVPPVPERKNARFQIPPVSRVAHGVSRRLIGNTTYKGPQGKLALGLGGVWRRATLNRRECASARPRPRFAPIFDTPELEDRFNFHPSEAKTARRNTEICPGKFGLTGSTWLIFSPCPATDSMSLSGLPSTTSRSAMAPEDMVPSSPRMLTISAVTDRNAARLPSTSVRIRNSWTLTPSLPD